MPRFRDRRKNKSQRAAVERVVKTASARTSVMRTGDGSVFVFEDHRDWSPPTTLRTRITKSGVIQKPDRLYHV